MYSKVDCKSIWLFSFTLFDCLSTCIHEISSSLKPQLQTFTRHQSVTWLVTHYIVTRFSYEFRSQLGCSVGESVHQQVIKFVLCFSSIFWFFRSRETQKPWAQKQLEIQYIWLRLNLSISCICCLLNTHVHDHLWKKNQVELLLGLIEWQ